MSSFYPNPIDITLIETNILRRFNVGENTDVVALKIDGQIKLFLDFCPHFGAQLSEGKFCNKTKTLQCPWHGYHFSAADGTMVDNPNDRIFSQMKKMYKNFDPSKTPKYRIKAMTYEIRDGFAYVLRQKAQEVTI